MSSKSVGIEFWVQAMTEVQLDLTVNGRRHRLSIPAHYSLLDVLRDELELTGTKTNCLEAECGVCTVILDGKSVTSCTVLAAQCNGRQITTIEGLAENSTPHPLQEAFVEFGAVQCGYCIPGMIMTAKAFLDENPRPTREAVREAIAGTLCRCTGYQKIVDAIMAASQRLSQQGERA